MSTARMRILLAAGLAAALCGCNENGKSLSSLGMNVDCPISQNLLGGIWHLNFGPTAQATLAGCQDASLNGTLVQIQQVPSLCVSPLPCGPFSVFFDARILLVVDLQEGGLISVQGTGSQPGDVMNAEIRTVACQTGFDFQQPGANEPLTIDIRCAGDFDPRTAEMNGDCSSAHVLRDGATTTCAIDPPFHPVVTLRPDPEIIVGASGS